MIQVTTDNYSLRKLIPKVIGEYASIDACEKLYSAYTEPWRTYHNKSHIVDMYTTFLAVVDEIYPENELWKDGILLMIFYHDTWYKVGREHGLNEKKSAEWALKDCGSYLQVPYKHVLPQGIEATVTHTLDGVDPSFHREVGLLLDLDLKTLGSPLPVFQEITEVIWKEYKPVYTREEFDTGRAIWARTFLERPFIYHTEWFKERFESQARKNLEALL